MSEEWYEDPADARRRTALAWQRTVLSVAGVAIVEFRLALGSGSVASSGLVVLAVLIGLVVFADSRRRQREVVRHSPRGVGHRAALLSVSVTLLLLAELGLVVLAG